MLITTACALLLCIIFYRNYVGTLLPHYQKTVLTTYSSDIVEVYVELGICEQHGKQ
jgi:hypothetical protein